MWCCKLDIGAHQECWVPLLQALFMTARTPTTMSVVAATIIKIEVFIAASRRWPLTGRIFVFHK
jgi:hypothetical protein